MQNVSLPGLFIGNDDRNIVGAANRRSRYSPGQAERSAQIGCAGDAEQRPQCVGPAVQSVSGHDTLRTHLRESRGADGGEGQNA